MNENPRNYNLLQEQWIPVLWVDGEVSRVGIREALAQAGRIRQIAASNPMDRVAILRFLLAILYWCKGNPADREDAKLADSFPPDWFAKLDANAHRFNLLGQGKRFYQRPTSGSAKPPKKLSANYLIHEIPTGINLWHFRHSTDEVHGLCPACCAMGLLRLPLFATSGGRGKPPGVNAKPPVYVMPIGVSLAASLRLSWREVSDLGTPAWEKPDVPLPKTGEVPLLMGLTWLPRRVWLDNPEEPKANCVSCGRKERLIRLCVFAGIGSTKTDVGGQGRIWRDPHVIEQSSKGGLFLRARDALGASDAAAGQWAEIMAGMLSDQRAHKPLWQAIDSNVAEHAKVDAWVVGFSTVQNDKYLEAMEYWMPSPSSPHQVQESLGNIVRWHEEGRQLGREVRLRSEKSQKEGRRKHVEIPPAINAIRPHVEARVSARADHLLAGGHDAWGQAAREYSPLMAAIAKSLSPGFTTAATQRRQQIAEVVPDMRAKTGPARKSTRKKGGGT